MKKNNSKTKSFSMIAIQFAMSIAVIVAIITASFAWFSASQPFVTANDGSFSAAEQPKDITGSAQIVSALGQYKGETGLGAYDTPNAPYFLELQITSPPIDVSKKETGKILESIVFEMFTKTGTGDDAKITPHLTLSGVHIGRNGEMILDCKKDDDAKITYKVNNVDYTKQKIINGFCWRIALLYEPYSKSDVENNRGLSVTQTKKVAIDNPEYMAPEDFTVTVKKPNILEPSCNLIIGGGEPIENCTNTIAKLEGKDDVVLVFSARLYFLDDASMREIKNPNLRTPFLFSGFDKSKNKYTDYTFMNTSFSFDYDFSAPVATNVYKNSTTTPES